MSETIRNTSMVFKKILVNALESTGNCVWNIKVCYPQPSPVADCNHLEVGCLVVLFSFPKIISRERFTFRGY